MKIRPVSVLLSLAFACGDRGGAARPAIEAPITRELATRFGGPATVTCAWIGTVAVGCRATFVDGAALVIAIAGHEWRVAGRAFATAPIVAYVRAELAELGKPDTVDCGPSVHAGVEP